MSAPTFSVGQTATFHYKGKRERIILGRGVFAVPVEYDGKTVKIEEVVGMDSREHKNAYLVSCVSSVSGNFLVFEDELE